MGRPKKCIPNVDGRTDRRRTDGRRTYGHTDKIIFDKTQIPTNYILRQTFLFILLMFLIAPSVSYSPIFVPNSPIFVPNSPIFLCSEQPLFFCAKIFFSFISEKINIQYFFNFFAAFDRRGAEFYQKSFVESYVNTL